MGDKNVQIFESNSVPNYYIGLNYKTKERSELHLHQKNV